MFTTPCLIRRNTDDLCKKLEALGYEWWSQFEDDKVLVATTFNPRIQSSSCPDELTPIYFSTGIDDIESLLDHGYIDCMENEDLFLALASLRDDSDKFQWFTDDNLMYWQRNGELEFSVFLFQSNIRYHKATVEELISHFL